MAAGTIYTGRQPMVEWDSGSQEVDENLSQFRVAKYILILVFSFISFQLFLLITWTAELYMFPLALLLIFAKNYLLIQMTGSAGDDEVRHNRVYN